MMLMEESYDWVLWDALKDHFGHNVTIAVYGDPKHPADVCLECKDCNQVVLDAEIYTLCPREDGYVMNIL